MWNCHLWAQKRQEEGNINPSYPGHELAEDKQATVLTILPSMAEEKDWIELNWIEDIDLFIEFFQSYFLLQIKFSFQKLIHTTDVMFFYLSFLVQMPNISSPYLYKSWILSSLQLYSNSSRLSSLSLVLLISIKF